MIHLRRKLCAVMKGARPHASVQPFREGRLLLSGFRERSGPCRTFVFAVWYPGASLVSLCGLSLRFRFSPLAPSKIESQESYKKKSKDWNSQADNYFNYMMDNFETELVVMGAKIALTNYKLPFDPSKLKSFDRFHKKFGKYVITAMDSK